MSNFNGNEAIIYCRVASGNELSIKHAIESQERRCREYAENHDHEVIEVFHDHGSGNTVDRPGMQDMLGFLEKRRGAGTVVVMADPGRLARSLDAYEALSSRIRGLGGSLEFAAGPVDHELFVFDWRLKEVSTELADRIEAKEQES